jgi:succinate-semialdehyde dehydrogenase/glutarate-semialdehyde dehydrogenase
MAGLLTHPRNADAPELVETQIQVAFDGDANVLTSGKRLNRKGYFLAPTILTEITSENPAFHVEFFAPVALIFRVKNQKEAIDLANDSPYGLDGSVITKDAERGERIACQIEAGMVFIDQATWTAPDLPLGGVKNFCYGRGLSDLETAEYLNKKLIA